MSRHTAPKCKLCRREGMKLFLKGQRCFSDKCALTRRNYPPGVHAHRRAKVTEYGIRLREKQKLKRIHGVQERQFRIYFKQAEQAKGNTGANLLSLLERRLDSAVLASGFAVSRNQARQLISHGHFTVNGRRVDVPSIRTRPGDVISVRKNDKTKKIVAAAIELNQSQSIPDWLSVDGGAQAATIVSTPTREHFLHPIQEQLIIELCSK